MAQLGATRSADGVVDVTDVRAELDDLDAQIINLLQRRVAVSRQAQQRRLEHGQPRLDLARENVIYRRYRDALGPAGADLAAAILYLCRGLFRPSV